MNSDMAANLLLHTKHDSNCPKTCKVQAKLKLTWEGWCSDEREAEEGPEGRKDRRSL